MYVRFAQAGEGMTRHIAVTYTNDLPTSPITPQERGLAQSVTQTAPPVQPRWAGNFVTYSPWPALVTE